MFMLNFVTFSVNGAEDLSECMYFMFKFNRKINPFSQYTCAMNECFTEAISLHFSERKADWKEKRRQGRRCREVELQARYVIP